MRCQTLLTAAHPFLALTSLRADANVKPAPIVPQSNGVINTAAALWRRLVGNLASVVQPAAKLRRASA